MKTYKIPNLKKIMEPKWAHKPGFGMSKPFTLHKREGLEQSSTPEDPNLLKKLGIKRGEKVLGIACYYASWASALAKTGAKVDYSDISKQMVSWSKRKYKRLFGKYMASNYELIPKNSNQYDWTFTYEACGGGSGLPIAYLRSLLNTRGGILIYHIRPKQQIKNMGDKPKRYPLIVKTLSKIYDTRCSVKEIKIKGHRLGKPSSMITCMVHVIRTNQRARELARQDLEALMSNKFSKENLERLSKLPIKEEFLIEKRLK